MVRYEASHIIRPFPFTSHDYRHSVLELSQPHNPSNRTASLAWFTFVAVLSFAKLACLPPSDTEKGESSTGTYAVATTYSDPQKRWYGVRRRGRGRVCCGERHATRKEEHVEGDDVQPGTLFLF